jgi:hypothetical protein
VFDDATPESVEAVDLDAASRLQHLSEDELEARLLAQMEAIG